MAAGYCYASQGFEFFRSTVLDDVGEPTDGAINLYKSDQGIDLDVKWRVESGAEYKQKLGNGNLCVNRKRRDTILGGTITLNACPWEYGLIAMVTGGKVAYDAGRPIGVDLGEVSTLDERRVCFEAWALAVTGEDRGTLGGDAAYHHHIFPSVAWRLGDFKLEDAVTPIQFVGDFQANSNISNGPLGDWPDFDNDDVATEGNVLGPWAAYLDVEIPTAFCGPTTLTTVGS